MARSWSELAGWRGRRLGPVEVLGEVDSTNAEALRRIDAAGAASGLVLIARRQLAGRGSRGRAWQDTPERSLALTVVLEWPGGRPPALATWLGAVAVTDLLQELDLPARVKWPNDALILGRKVAGVLAELHSARDRPAAVALGIGLNVGQEAADFTSLAGGTTPPTSLALERRPVALPEAALRLLESLDRRAGELEAEGEPLRAAFLERLGLLGQTVVATLPDRSVAGRLEALELDGTLRIDGEPIAGGHVTALLEL